jgi:hypothetical protein
MKRFAKATTIALSLCVLGALLHICEIIHAVIDRDGQAFAAGDLLFLGGLLLWSCMPYLICASLAMVKKEPVFALGGALGTFTFDLYMYYSVFIHPVSSTAALGLLFAPLWNLLLFGPLGAAILWLAVTLFRKFSSGQTSRNGK